MWKSASAKPTTLLPINHYSPHSFLSSLNYLNLNVKWKNSAFARSILILAFSERLQIQRVAPGFFMVHKYILRVRLYKRSFDFIGTSLITSETVLLILGKRMKETDQRPGILSKSHSIRDFLSDLRISFLELSLFSH